ncbi:MAG: glutathione binding-like protein, partial [Alphaproteobacteria bacterium]
PVRIGFGEQFAPEFLAFSPNNKTPAMIDRDGPGGTEIRMFESGAILIYLAEKCGRFLPTDLRPRMETLQWLMFQMGGVGPFFRQAHHFLRFAPEPVPYAVTRYSNETRRLYGVMDKHLGGAEYLAAGDYTIADIATFPWVARHEWQEVDLAAFPNVKRWYDAIWARTAVKNGYDVP